VLLTASQLQASSSLLNSPLFRRLAADPDLVQGYASGEILTVPARTSAHQVLKGFKGRFTKPRYQRSPDREKSLVRRHTLASTWNMPPGMAGKAKLTVAQRAHAKLLSDEHAKHGRCTMTLDEQAARIGVCRKTAKRSQDRFEELGLISVEERKVTGRKNLPNVIRIVSAEWLAWIENGPQPRRSSIGGHERTATVNQFILKRSATPIAPVERPQGARQWGRIACPAPEPGTW